MVYSDPRCGYPVIGGEEGRCQSEDALTYFSEGWRCPLHTHNALRGLPELKPGPGIPAYRGCKKCGHIRMDHPGIDPFTPGKCKGCKDRHQYVAVD